MKTVLDTNVLLVIVGKKSDYHSVYHALLKGNYQLCLTTEILLEYQEVLTRKHGWHDAENTLRAIMLLPNLLFLPDYKRWNLIKTDPDDNKFVDCAIAAGAKFLVSEDRHFRILSQIEEPKVEVITLQEFVGLLEKLE